MDFFLLKWSRRFTLCPCDLGDGSTDYIAATFTYLYPILAKAGISQNINVNRFFVVHIVLSYLSLQKTISLLFIFLFSHKLISHIEIAIKIKACRFIM